MRQRPVAGKSETRGHVAGLHLSRQWPAHCHLDSAPSAALGLSEPTRASSMNQELETITLTRLGRSRKRAAGPHFQDCCLGLLVGHQVHRARRLSRQVQAAQHAGQAGRAQPLVGAPLDPAAQHRLGAAILAAEDRIQQYRLLRIGQLRGSTCFGPVEQPAESRGIVADHRVPQRLPLHACQARRLGGTHAPSARDREHPRRRVWVAFPVRQLRPDLKRRSDSSLCVGQPGGIATRVAVGAEPSLSTAPGGIRPRAASGSRLSKPKFIPPHPEQRDE